MPNTLRDDLHKINETSFDYVYEKNATIELKNMRVEPCEKKCTGVGPAALETWKGSRAILTVTVSENVTWDQYLERKRSEGSVEARLLIFAGDDLFATTTTPAWSSSWIPQGVPINVEV